jgi:PAS domain S-box-containing protein
MIMSELRNTLRAMLAEENRLLRQRLEQAASAETWVRMAVLAGLVVGLLGGILSVVLFTTGIAKRIAIIGDQAEALTAGRRTEPQLGGNDEIAALERKLAAAGALLVDRELQLRMANEQLEQRVRERTEELVARTQELERQAMDRRRVDAALRASEDRFRLFMQYLPAVAFIKDANGRYLYGNAAWRSRFPNGTFEPEGKTDADLWPPETAAVFAESDRKVLTDGGPIQLVETARFDGEVRHLMVNKFLMVGPDGATLIGGVAFDMTESKRLETQLYQAQKLEAIGLLAGGVAHDFNNLLTVILGYADVARAGRHPKDPLLDSLKEIHKAAEQAGSLTTQLLAFGRKQVMQPRVLNLNTVLEGIQRMLRRLLRENVQLNLSLARRLSTTIADPVQIQQVVMNLACNSQDAMPDGGQLTIETADVVLDEAYAMTHRPVQPGNYVMLAVSDTGTGMDAATRGRVFEPFFTTKEMGKGTGLGLATVYGIVKQSGGYIWVYSEPGQGTTFKIYLPRAEAVELLASESAAATSLPARPGQTILVVEDESAVRRLIVKACSQAGYELLEAANGDDALALSTSYPGSIDLLITDVIMPGISGRTLADQITASRPGVRVLYCSGYAETAIIQHGVLEQGLAFLQKPFTPATLLQAIGALLAEAGATR